LDRRLKDLVVRAEPQFPVTSRLEFEVWRNTEGYDFRISGEHIFFRTDPEWLTLHLHQRINAMVLHPLSDHVLIHAACGTYQGKRFLLAGDRRAGKTTLLMSLLHHGAEAHSDDLVLLRGAEVIPFPRRFHIKEGALDCLPSLGDLCRRRFSYATLRERFYFLDPLDLNREWRTEPGRVDAVFALKAHHHGDPSIERIPKYLMMEHVLNEIENFSPNTPKQLADVCRMVDGSDCFLLRVGRLRETAGAFREMLAGA